MKYSDSIPTNVKESDKKEKERLEKEHQAMLDRLNKLNGNELVEDVLRESSDEKSGEDDLKSARFDVVHSLVWEAWDAYNEGELSFEKTMANLAEAIQALSKNSS